MKYLKTTVTLSSEETLRHDLGVNVRIILVLVPGGDLEDKGLNCSDNASVSRC